jgi:hypothetical protein
MPESGRVFKVMLSSTFFDLVAERNAARDAILGQKMLPLLMEVSPAMPDRGLIANSLAMVDEADIYVVLISNYRYGQVIEDAKLNPLKLSVTELEFRRAEELGLLLCIFLEDDGAPLNGTATEVMKEFANYNKLQAFRSRANDPKRINVGFGDAKDIKASLTHCLSRLKTVLEKKPPTPPSDATQRPAAPGLLPSPPAFVAKPPYTPGHAFEGRKQELALLDDWARGDDPVLVLEAIGGMGKSMLTWHWVSTRAPKLGIPWAGRFWYSFYERGADMREFAITAVTYMTQQPPEALRKLPEAEIMESLLLELQRQPWLLVLDGLERVLVAYHRSDAAQTRDDEIEGNSDRKGVKLTDSIRPADDDMLRQLAASGPSRLVMTSRLMPHVLWADFAARPGVRHEVLQGLTPDDAEAMLRRAGISGDGERMQRHLKQTVGGHPLVVGFVAGLVRNALWAKMSFDRWIDDPRGGAAVNLADPELKQRQTHILKQAFDALEPDARALMARLGMLSGAVGLDVLEALNPRRPDPPRVVREPRLPGEFWDPGISRWSHWREDERPNGARDLHQVEMERQKARHQRDYESDCKAFEAYQAALAAWRQSPVTRAASRWLHDTLKDLEERGLVQLDRRNGTIDLHPVVRGYAVGCLDTEARGTAGQHVADYFASQTAPAYSSATSLSELSNQLQVVQALILARKLDSAWSALRPLEEVIRRLERSDLLLALLKPWFPDGWRTRPVSVAGSEGISMATRHALWDCGWVADVEAQVIIDIQDMCLQTLSRSLATQIHNHASVLKIRGSLAQAQCATSLARDISTALNDDHDLLHCDQRAIDLMIVRGEYGSARKLWDTFQQKLPSSYLCDTLDKAKTTTEGDLLHREGALTAAWLKNAIDHVRAKSWRSDERSLLRLQGIWLQEKNSYVEAVQSFDSAVEMARESGLSDRYSEVRRGLSLLSLGNPAAARSAAASAERDPPHGLLATLYKALGDDDKAREHALKGYKDAWADGPPHSWHWDLQQCRAVLKALNEPEPVLSPYDAEKVPPLPYEAAVRRKIAQHLADKD